MSSFWPFTSSPQLAALLLSLVSFVAGGVAVVSVFEGPKGGPKKLKKQHLVPSFLEAMYLYEIESGIGEEIPSTPRKDGFRMPAEWEPHSG